MRALVTGCAGFIGSHMVDRLLKEGYEVIGIDCFTDYYPREIKISNIKNALSDNHFKLIEQDIVEVNSFPDADYIFHHAAQPGVRKSWGNDFNIYVRDNILATQRLLEAYKDRNITKFIFASSSSVYGDAELPLKEEKLPKPLSPYGVTKLAAENLCHLYYQNYGVPVISLRYFTVYGPRQRPDMAINKFFKAISNNEEIIVYGNGEQTRDFTFINDIIQANLLAASSKVNGEVYNVGGGSNISVNGLIKKIEQITGKKARLKYVDKQKGDVQDTLAGIGKIKTFFNWRPMVKLEEGLIAYFEWLKG